MSSSASSTRRPVLASLLMSGAALFWALNYQVASTVLAEMTPVSLTFWRWLIACGPLFVLAWVIERPDWRIVARRLPQLVLLSGLGLLGYNLLLYWALHFTTPIGAVVINAANPALIVLLAVVLTGQSVSRRGVLGIVVSLAGVLLVLSQGSPTTLVRDGVNTGQLFMLGAITVWSLYTIWGRVDGVGPITSTAVQSAIAVVALSPWAVSGHAPLPTSQAGVLGLLLIAALPSVGSYVLWNTATSMVSSAAAAVHLNLITVFVVIIGVFRGQPLSLADLIGATLIIVGVVTTSLAAAPPKHLR